MTRLLALAIVLVPCLVAPARARVSRADACLGAQLSAVGQHDGCVLKAYATKVAKHLPAIDTRKCDGQLVAHLAKIAAKFGAACPTPGDAGPLGGENAGHAGKVFALLHGTVCGNGVLEVGEDCDGSNLAGATCASLGFGDGTLACTGSCTFATGGCGAAICGNGIRSGTETCDGADFGGATCATFGFTGGTLACNAACDTIDTSGCTEACGDGVLNRGEDCDGTHLGSKTCQSFKFEGGTLACAADCTFDTSGCTVSCDPKAQNCDAGSGCYAGLGCKPAGTVGLHAPCTKPDDCAAGLACSGGPDAQCRAYCNAAVAPTCPPGDVCVDMFLPAYPGLGICAEQ